MLSDVFFYLKEGKAKGAYVGERERERVGKWTKRMVRRKGKERKGKGRVSD